MENEVQTEVQNEVPNEVQVQTEVLVQTQSETLGLDKFITEKMFLDLAGCIIFVTTSVELAKHYIPLNPLLLNLIITGLVTLMRILFLKDFSAKGIMLGLINFIPILLGATGTFEYLKHIATGVA